MRWGQVVGSDVRDPFRDAVAAPVAHEDRERTDVSAGGGKFGTAGQNRGELACFGVGQCVGVAGDPAGHCPDSRFRWWEDWWCRRLAGLVGPQEPVNVVGAAAVAEFTQFGDQGGDIGVPGIPAGQQIRHELIALHSFATGLERDFAAVTVGLTLPWSNGPTEGTVNKVKALKRQCFGRSNLDLLRKRILLSHNQSGVPDIQQPPARSR